MQQKTNTISVQQCVSGQWGRPDLYQLCLCVPECSSFIWRQGGSQAARPHSYSSNLPRKKKKTKQNTEELLSATLLTSSGGKCLYMINKTWCQSLSVLGIFHSNRSNTSRAWWGTKTRCRGGNSTTLTPFNCLNILILNIILLDQAALTTIACIIHAHIFTYIEHVGIKYYVHWEEEVKWHFYTELFPSAQITIHFIQSHTHSHTASVFSSFLKLFIYGAHTYT